MTETKQKERHGHPYLSGNFAPVHQEQHLTLCEYSGTLPDELAGGQYVRNGGNPVTNEALGRDAHWFDGDGMLSGVSFRRVDGKGTIQPEFVNKYVLTDVFITSKSSPHLKTPMLPSIATLVDPMSSLFKIILRIFRTIALVILSHLPGSQQAIKKISVANTAVLYHDGRALATCESGPPMHFALPGLETVGWFNGHKSEGEGGFDKGDGLGGPGIIGFMKEWTTAHPRVDPKSKELIMYHNTFIPPYVHYSIISSNYDHKTQQSVQSPTSIINRPVPGITSAKMMHDFGVSHTHTVIMDLPLSLDPLNLAKNKPVVSYDPTAPSRFGLFPRYQPHKIRWYETNPCCIFHTVNTWKTYSTPLDTALPPSTPILNLLACRLTSASLVFSAGNLPTPPPPLTIPTPAKYAKEEDQCRLYYYQFSLLAAPPGTSSSLPSKNGIINQWALSALTFEFPSLRPSASMSAAKYIYGCSISTADSFGTALGRAVKIDSLVKIDVETLIERGKTHPPAQITGCVDTRRMSDILASTDPDDPIKVFRMPEGWYAQESRFVPRRGDGGGGGETREDDGWLLVYVFDEGRFLDAVGECVSGARSELWVVDARSMREVVARVVLPQRVPYGLHGNWFSEEEVRGQRPVERVRVLGMGGEGGGSKVWGAVRGAVEKWLG